MTEREALEQVLPHATGEAHFVIKRMIIERRVKEAKRSYAKTVDIRIENGFRGAKLP